MITPQLSTAHRQQQQIEMAQASNLMRQQQQQLGYFNEEILNLQTALLQAKMISQKQQQLAALTQLQNANFAMKNINEMAIGAASNENHISSRLSVSSSNGSGACEQNGQSFDCKYRLQHADESNNQQIGNQSAVVSASKNKESHLIPSFSDTNVSLKRFKLDIKNNYSQINGPLMQTQSSQGQVNSSAVLSSSMLGKRKELEINNSMLNTQIQQNLSALSAIDQGPYISENVRNLILNQAAPSSCFAAQNYQAQVSTQQNLFYQVPQEMNLSASLNSPSMPLLETTNTMIEPVIVDLRKQILINRGRVLNQKLQQLEKQSPINQNVHQSPAQINAQLITQLTSLPSQPSDFALEKIECNAAPLLQPTHLSMPQLKQEILQNLSFALGGQDVKQNNSSPRLLNLLLDYFMQNELSHKSSPADRSNKDSSNNPPHDHNSLIEESCESGTQSGTASNGSKKERVIACDKVMQITKCPHTNRKHYAKNMCSSCYRKYGRSQYASNCPHSDRLLYSMGMCQTCYLSDYHKRRNKSSKAAAPDEIEEAAVEE